MSSRQSWKVGWRRVKTGQVQQVQVLVLVQVLVEVQVQGQHC